MQKVKTKISKTVIVVFVVILIAVFYAMSIKPKDRLPLHHQIIITLFSPFQKIIDYTGNEISNVWNSYFSLVDAAEENLNLKVVIDDQRLKLGRLSELEVENNRLRMLLDFKEKAGLKGTGARVIANDPRGDFRVVTIDKGEKDGVEVNMPVISPEGLVGRVADTAGKVSRVLLITDPNSAVDVMVQRSRARALLVGKLAKTELRSHYYLSRLEYLERRSDILEGDVIVTSGVDEIYPPGIPVGHVTKINNGDYGVFKEAVVVPFADFNSLENIVIVKSFESPGEIVSDKEGS